MHHRAFCDGIARRDFLRLGPAGIFGFGLTLPEILAHQSRAAESGRVLVSHDYHTMPGHFASFLASGQHSPGVLLLHQTLPVAQAIEALLLVWDASAPEEWRDTLTYLPLWR